MQLTDTHAHIYLPEFDADRPGVMAKAAEAGVQQILMPAIDSSTHSSMLQIEQEFENCIAMMGLHPCSVKEDYEQELKLIEAYLSQRPFIAVGEIGLDFYWDKTFTEQQYDAFHRQIEFAVQYDLPIAIHSRNATAECIEVVKKHPDVRGVFHCFSGTLEQAHQIIDLNFLLGIGGVVTFKNAGLDKLIPSINLDHLILETDAPYLAPVPYRGKRNEIGYLKLIAQKIAALTNKTEKEITDRTTQNAIKLFKLPQQTVT